MSDWITDGIRLIRNSEDLGENSCSYYAECYSDDELREEIQWWIDNDMWSESQCPDGVLNWARHCESVRKVPVTINGETFYVGDKKTVAILAVDLPEDREPGKVAFAAKINGQTSQSGHMDESKFHQILDTWKSAGMRVLQQRSTTPVRCINIVIALDKLKPLVDQEPKYFPNLDHASLDELEEIKTSLRDLASYINWKQIAMSSRIAGNIEAAQKHEATMEKIYDGLPDWAKW